ncbi:DgyrCDS738 [Dimorphilus gyrociliatus]|uniref:DgyrCDS738 n=1 Tax=Dimorphilus gyrociliatus TaxID=2664684 RepID=A0A7I8V5A7_9ANNE|nr:DgyrCDS738 [Dimorphilus gyrociliatus]
MGDEKIVMTPTKRGKSTAIRLEKIKKSNIDLNQVHHSGGGAHSRLVVNKMAKIEDGGEECAELSMEFRCFLVNKKTSEHICEKRVLYFWFRENSDHEQKICGARDFFLELINPDDFPGDYPHFIKKAMKLLEKSDQYYAVLRVEVEMTPVSPEISAQTPFEEDNRPRDVIVQEQLLSEIERHFPNCVDINKLLEVTNEDHDMVISQLQQLIDKKLIKRLDDEGNKYIRNLLYDKSVREMKQMPVQQGIKKPSIAIITSSFFEKMAIDSMMSDKTTFVKFKQEGDGNVYTIGSIGKHRVVSTKLPIVGRDRSALISSGNSTTRLLGTFSDVEHVILLGICGGVPDYVDYRKHVRLGDIIVSVPNSKGISYIFADKVERSADNIMKFSLKSWNAKDLVVSELSESLQTVLNDLKSNTLEDYMGEAAEELGTLQNAHSFSRPQDSSDILYMRPDKDKLIRIEHPKIPEDANIKQKTPIVRLGCLASGRPFEESILRSDFAIRHQVIGFDPPLFDQVMESVVGNCKDSFIFIRGVSDYEDGANQKSVWKHYAALSAAAFARILIENLSNL